MRVGVPFTLAAVLPAMCWCGCFIPDQRVKRHKKRLSFFTLTNSRKVLHGISQDSGTLVYNIIRNLNAGALGVGADNRPISLAMRP